MVKILRVFLVLIPGAWLCGLASAQSLAGCPGIERAEGIKVVLDKLEFKGPDGRTHLITEELKNEFSFELMSRLKNLFPDDDPHPVLCSMRAPSPDGSDFDPELVRSLNGRSVLLEIWGAIKQENKNGQPAFGGNILMMIIPVRHYPENGGGRLDFQILSYPASITGKWETASPKIALGTEFNVYAGIAQGMKELKNESYDKAKKCFSKARIEWDRALKKGNLANTPTDQGRVLDYIQSLEDSTVAKAARDPHYKGSLVAVEIAAKEKRP